MGRILLFSDIELPTSCALSVRVMTFAKLFRDAGNEVIVIGTTANKEEEKHVHFYEGIAFSLFYYSSSGGIGAFKRIKEISTQIKDYLYKGNNAFDAVFLSNIYFDFSKVFYRYSKKKHVPIIIHSVEWYDKRDIAFRGLFGIIKFIKNRIALRFIIPKFNNVVAISSFLSNYYEKKGCHVVCIPTIVDMKEYENARSTKNKNLVISYAGSPAKKDIIVNAVKAMMLLPSETRDKVELHFYGVSKNDFFSMGLQETDFDLKDSHIYCHGRINQDKVKDVIAASDFTFLIRPNKKYSNAGFPTKIGESLACGTPVMVNMTSDLPRYIFDGANGIVLKDESPMCFARAIERALSLTDEQKNKMRKNAKDTAASSFSYTAYLDSISVYFSALTFSKGDKQ